MNYSVLSLLIFNILTLLCKYLFKMQLHFRLFMLLLLLLVASVHVRFCVTPEMTTYRLLHPWGLMFIRTCTYHYCLGLCESTPCLLVGTPKGHKEHAENSLNMMRPSSLCPFNYHALSAHHWYKIHGIFST